MLVCWGDSKLHDFYFTEKSLEAGEILPNLINGPHNFIFLVRPGSPIAH
jgi:hypothetical protein